jgi:dTDP-4-dehydrorhamnose reductase
MPTWLVTGANGFLGSNAGVFLEGKVETVGQVRTGSASPTFTISAAVDLANAEAVTQLVDSVKPSVIFHSAAMSSHEACERDPAGAIAVNAEATATLANAAASCGALMIYISTDAVFDGTRGSYTETDVTNPFSVYGESKLAGEDEVRAATDHHLILRTNFFGWSPSGTRSILEFFVNGFRNHTKMKGYTDFTVTSLYAPHLLSVTTALVHRGSVGTFHVASSDALSKYDFGRTVAEAFSLDSALLEPSASSIAGHLTSRSRDLSLSTAKLASALGQQLPSQAEGIASAYDDEAALTGRLRGTGAGPPTSLPISPRITMATFSEPSIS